jgi:coenzyme F420 biosynthesis associated uncharacterized protein
MSPKSNNDFRRLGTVFLVAMVASAGVRYVLERAAQNAKQRPTRLIDWNQARQIALRFSQTEQAPLTDRALRQDQYARLVAQSEPLLTDYMGVALPAPIQQIYVVDRREWLEANFTSFAHLFQPVEDLYQHNMQSHSLFTMLFGGLNSQVVGAQIGFLLGFLARRVLGQYDLSIFSPNPQSRGVLYFVEPNINLVQRQLGLSDEEFRLWITIHECTHVFQFEAYPWVRNYFQSLLNEFFGEMSNQLTTLGSGLQQMLEQVLRGNQDGRHWIEQMLTPTQRSVFERMQALMTVIEGYSNHTMDAIGSQIMPSFAEIERRVAERQANRPVFEVLFNRVTGMDLKLAQYREGEAFVNAVVAARGKAFANRVWRGPDYLPTQVEIRAPQRWIERIERLSS